MNQRWLWFCNDCRLVGEQYTSECDQQCWYCGSANLQSITLAHAMRLREQLRQVKP